jgi:hypothetical protein
VARLLAVVRDVVEGLHYTPEIAGGSEWTLVSRAGVRGPDLEGADVLRLDDQGKAREIVVFVRPLQALTALSAELGPRLARRRGRTRSALVSAFTRPLAAVTRWADPLGAQLAGGGSP